MSVYSDPYLARGLRGNPFVAESVPGTPRDCFIDRGFPPPPGGKIFHQLIGPKGAGKTTLLLRWREMRSGPYRHFPSGLGRIGWPEFGPVNYWDEADRIPRALFTAYLRMASLKGQAVAVGTHRDLSAAALCAGFEVRTYEFSPITPEEVARWAQRRVRAAARRPESPPEFPLPEKLARDVAREAGCSWRTAGDRLHVWASSLP